MAYTMKVQGMDEVSRMLADLGDKAMSAASKGLYDGAGAMAAELNKGADSIQTAPFKYAKDGETRMPSPEEKEALKRAKVGIARFEKDGDAARTSVGYDNAGYTKMVGKTVPIPVIANAVNSGTSFMDKQPFFRKAATKGTKKAESAIIAKIEAEIDAITKTEG